MERFGVLLAVLWTSFLQLGLCEVKMPYYLSKDLEDEVRRDDNKEELLKVRKRIAKGMNKTYGVVMVSPPSEMSYSVHTIPVWKAYCEKHGYDFFLMERSLASSFRDHWTKPRLLMELVSEAKWKYLWMVDPHSLPVDMEKGWQYIVKQHMRQVRYKNDNQKTRVLWCPEDCEKEYEPMHQEGACYGPLMSGCVFWMKKDLVLPILKTWYGKRNTMNEDTRGLKKGLQKAREDGNYDAMMWTDTREEMGRADSTFLASHTYDEKLGYNIRDQVVKTITKYKLLGNVLNKDGEHRPDELTGKVEL